MYINTDADDWLFDITNKSNREMALRQRNEYTHSSPSYLGAIVSQDRQTIYWVNRTKPIP
jgi:hypothetical protein